MWRGEGLICLLWVVIDWSWLVVSSIHACINSLFLCALLSSCLVPAVLCLYSSALWFAFHLSLSLSLSLPSSQAHIIQISFRYDMQILWPHHSEILVSKLINHIIFCPKFPYSSMPLSALSDPCNHSTCLTVSNLFLFLNILNIKHGRSHSIANI